MMFANDGGIRGESIANDYLDDHPSCPQYHLGCHPSWQDKYQKRWYMVIPKCYYMVIYGDAWYTVIPMITHADFLCPSIGIAILQPTWPHLALGKGWKIRSLHQTAVRKLGPRRPNHLLNLLAAMPVCTCPWFSDGCFRHQNCRCNCKQPCTWMCFCICVNTY